MGLPVSEHSRVPLEPPEELFKIVDMLFSRDTEMRDLGCVLFSQITDIWITSPSTERRIVMARLRIFIKRIVYAREHKFLPRHPRLMELHWRCCV